MGDPLTYRPKGEVDVWKTPERDPISRFSDRLQAEYGYSADDLDALRQQARADVDTAIAFAKDSPEPELVALWEDVYSGGIATPVQS